MSKSAPQKLGMIFTKVPGTRDILPAEVHWWQKREEIARKVFSLYNYQEMRPPLLEKANLFNRSLGESSEIVQKQMFLATRYLAARETQADSWDLYALRPEGTASVVRAYLENNLDKIAGLSKFYYCGPMFRAERPQKGRLRQFHHLGAEAIGSTDARLDAEIISLADTLLKAFAIEGYKIKINSLGCAQDKKALSGPLRQELKDKIHKLCPDCQRRFKNNVLRILDCKKEACQEIIRKLEIKDAHLCPECLAHFSKVKKCLQSLKIDYQIAPLLVRGLDYYTRTVFEIVHQKLGSQDALGAGGRYDSLVKELGGPQVGAMGFALGMERLFLVSKATEDQSSGRNLTYIISLGEEATEAALKLLFDLRQAGIPADTDYENKSLKGALRRANDLKARYVLILGEDELKKNIVTFKVMASGEQKEIKTEELIKELIAAYGL